MFDVAVSKEMIASDKKTKTRLNWHIISPGKTTTIVSEAGIIMQIAYLW